MIRIKKYGNRRLYNTETSRYVNLDEIAALIREGQSVVVVDATTGEDLTRAVLLQIVLEVNQGAEIFPPGLLHRIIRSLGDHPAQRFLFQQLGSALSLMDAQIVALEEQFPWMKAGSPGWGATKPGAKPASEPEPEPEPTTQQPEAERPKEGRRPEAPDTDSELAALRARLASLEARLKRG